MSAWRTSLPSTLSLRTLGIAAVFGLASAAVHGLGLSLQAAGANYIADARDLFVTLGAALTGPAGAVVVGVLASVLEPDANLRFVSVCQHLVGSVLLGWLYWNLLKSARRIPLLIIGWAGLVLLYYLVVALLGKPLFALLNPDPLSPLRDSASFFSRGWLFQLLVTALITAVALAAIPPVYRFPVWRSAAEYLTYVRRLRRPLPAATAFAGLPVRLAAWFLVLSTVPLAVLGVSMQADVSALVAADNAGNDREEATTLASSLADLSHQDRLRALASFNRSGRQSAVLVDSAGGFLSPPDSLWQATNLRETFGEGFPRSMEGKGSVRQTDHGTLVNAPVPGRPLTVVLRRETKDVGRFLYAVERSSWLRLAASMVLIALIGGMVIWLYLVRPFRRFAWAAGEVGRGNFDIRIRTIDMDSDVAALGERFNVMVKSLRSSEEKFAKAFRTSPDSVNINRLSDGLYIDCNAGFTRLTGYTAADVIGKSSVALNIWANSRDRDRLVRGIRENGEVANLEAEFRRKDGSILTGLMSAKLINIDGEPCILNVTRDITERKRAEQAIEASLREKELLLKEIHHRVKNNLQIISSLLNLQAGAIRDHADRELFRDSQNRIRSMALIHEKLYQSADFAGVDFRLYLESLLRSLLQTYHSPNVTFSTSVEDIHLTIDTAIPCGLIINELITNAIKYAFPDNRQGLVSVGLARLEETRVELTVSDNGVGLPPDLSMEDAKSLGLHLVRILTEQLGGTLELTRNGGAAFRVVFPLT